MLYELGRKHGLEGRRRLSRYILDDLNWDFKQQSAYYHGFSEGKIIWRELVDLEERDGTQAPIPTRDELPTFVNDPQKRLF